MFPGMTEMSFIFQKYNTDSNSDLKFEIKELRVTGIEYADNECLPCTKGFS